MSYKSVKDVVTLLTENGFWFVRQKGSHMVYTDGSHVVKALRKALITTF